MKSRWLQNDDFMMTRPEINFQLQEGFFVGGVSHTRHDLKWNCARGDCFSGVRRKIEEIDGGGGLFVCPIHGGGRGGKKHWNINFLFAVFIIGRRRRRRSEMTNGAREEMNSVFPPAGGTDAKFQPRRGAFFGTV